MTTASGRPVADNQNVQTAGRPGPDASARSLVFGKTFAFRPRGDPRTAYACQGFGRLRYVHRDARHYRVYPRLDLLGSR